MERWRKIFEGAGIDICSLIEKAITFAASHYPEELRARRERIAQMLFSPGFVRCGECHSLTLVGPDSFPEDDNIKGAMVPRCEGHHSHDKSPRDDVSPDSKVTTSSNEVARIRSSNYSYDEAEALTEEIEEESEALREVDRIKGILSNPDESEKQIYECLRRLELMQLSVNILQATSIGHVVSRLKKHNSEEIQTLSRKLIRSWKDLADVWFATADAVAQATIGKSPSSVSLEAVKDEEVGLPSPPLDEGAFFTTQTTSMEISQFFDEMDDDGNPRSLDMHDNNVDDDDDNKLNNSKQSLQRSKMVRESNATLKQVKDRRNEEKGDITAGLNKERGTMKSSIQYQKYTDCPKSSINASARIGATIAPSRNLSGTPKQTEQRDLVCPLTDSAKNQIRPSSLPPRNKPQSSDNIPVSARVEASKRKLQEGYQQAENARKQRTVQLMDLQDLPKYGRSHMKPSHLKRGSQNRQQLGNFRS